MIEKLARKPYADPVQEKLRQDKALWNKGVSVFITNLINLKKTMNGSPSKYFKERSKIVQPIPANPVAIIDSLAGAFQELAQQGSSIVQEQLAYSKNRRPKQQKAPETPKAPATPTTTAPAAPATDLSKQLAAWEQKYEMVVEGSNPLSRFLTRRLTRTRGVSEKHRTNRMRLNMLNSCNKARKALNRLQVEIVKSSPQSITESNKIMKHVWDEWAVVARTFNLQKGKPEKDNVELPTEEALSPARETLGDEPNQPSNEVALPAPSPPPMPPNPYVSPIDTAEPASPNNEAIKSEEMTEEQIKKKKIQDLVKNVMQKTNPKPVSSATIASAQMEIIAQKFVKKWLGKKRHQFFSGNTSSYRLEIFELAKQARVQLNSIMNLLEKGFDTEAMSPLISQVNKQMTTMRMLMRSLHMSEKPDATGGDGIF